MVRKETNRIFTPDQTLLCADYYDLAESDNTTAEPRVPIIIVHGYCEHRGRYRLLAEHLVGRGHPVVTVDLRGHGESSGPRAHVQRFSEYLQDVTALFDHAEARWTSQSKGDKPAAKPILLGHSMGGLVATRFLLEDPAFQGRVSALALSSPFFGLKIPVPAWKRGLGRLASVVYPGLSLPSDLDPACLSHDPQVVAAYVADPLVSRVATARWFTEAMTAQHMIRERAPRLAVPLLLMHGGDDAIADPAASQAFFDRVKAKEKVLTLYPGLFHEIFNERDDARQQVLTDLGAWLQRRSRA